MTYVDRLEQFWHDVVLTFPETVRIEGAIISNVLGIPLPIFNHATNINIGDEGVEDFIYRVSDHFSSKKLPFACFRTSPLMRPPSLPSLLESRGFKVEEEQSIMVFEGKPPINMLNPGVKIKEIPENKVDTFVELLLTTFEMPIEWRAVSGRLLLEWQQRGAKNYMAYAEGKPVGVTTLLPLKKTGCIFNVGTLKEFRRRGIGTTLVVNTLSESLSGGNDLHTLQTTKGGDAERLYQRIGFKIDHTVAFFVRQYET